MNEEKYNSRRQALTVFVIGLGLGIVVTVLTQQSRDENTRHIFSHIQKQYILEAKEQIASEKASNSAVKNHISKGEQFRVTDLKP